ncbi:MAG: hypothetical protein JOY99_12800 [Sphingomonadaceae bacterium]|nr:hypothetical protein [Sphingomonadaceae bacterium]
MFEVAAFTYTLLAGFILSSAGRNRREQRPHHPTLKLFGIVMMAMSFTLAALLVALAAYMAVTR